MSGIPQKRAATVKTLLKCTECSSDKKSQVMFKGLNHFEPKAIHKTYMLLIYLSVSDSCSHQVKSFMQSTTKMNRKGLFPSVTVLSSSFFCWAYLNVQ